MDRISVDASSDIGNFRTFSKRSSFGRRISHRSRPDCNALGEIGKTAVGPPWTTTRKFLATVLDSSYTEALITISLVIHLLFTVIAVDTEASGQVVPVWLSGSMKFLEVAYCFEVAVRIYVLRTEFFLTNINVFEFAIVVADVIVGLSAMIVDEEAFANFVALRILRTSRVLRSSRVLVHFRSLFLLVHGASGAMRAVIWAFVMISISLLLCSIFAVVAIQPYVVELATTTDVFDGCTRCALSYASVWHAYMTFFQQVVAGDAWGAVTMDVIDAHPWTALFFIPAYMVIHLGLINMILTVIVDSADAAREADHAHRLELKEWEAQKAQRALSVMCSQLDHDESGELTLDELMYGYEHIPDFRSTLNMMDIGKEDMKTVFNILDQDKSGTCTYAEFVESLWKMKSEDSHTLLVFIKSYCLDLKRSIDESMSLLQNDIGVKLAEVHAVQAGSEGDERYLSQGSSSYPSLLMCTDGRTAIDDQGSKNHDDSWLLKAAADRIEDKIGTLSQRVMGPFDNNVCRATIPSVASQWRQQLHQQTQQRQQGEADKGYVAGKGASPTKAPVQRQVVAPVLTRSDCSDLAATST